VDPSLPDVPLRRAVPVGSRRAPVRASGPADHGARVDAGWRSRADLLVAPVLVLLIGLSLAVLRSEHAPSPDAVSYLSIAEHAVRGEWGMAFNSYWSPLLSLALLPAGLAGWPLQPAARVLCVLVGCVTMVLLQRTMWQTGVSAPIARIMSVTAVPFVVFATFHAISPDLLMATLLLGFALETVRPSGSAVRAGIHGGLAFLAKAYALPVVLITLAAIVLIRRLVPSRRTDPAHPFVTASIACAIALVWIVPVSIEQGRFTISAAASYHRDIAAPGSLGNAFQWAGLIEPAYPGDVSGWKNPATLPRPADRPAFAASRQRPEHLLSPADRHGKRLKRLGANLSRLHKCLDLLLGAMLASLLWAASTARRVVTAGRRQTLDEAQRQALELCACAVVYTSGLLLLVVETRYLYLPLLIAIVLAAIWLGERRAGRPGAASLLPIGLVAVATVVGPLSSLHSSFERAGERATLQAFIASAAGDLQGQRVASVPASLGKIGSVCYALGCTYLGAPRTDVAMSVSGQLEDFEIDLLVVIGDRTLSLPGFSPVATLQHDTGHGSHRYTVHRARSVLEAPR